MKRANTIRLIRIFLRVLPIVVITASCSNSGSSDHAKPDAGLLDGGLDSGIDAGKGDDGEDDGGDDGGNGDLETYSATITWTTYGIPHIVADSVENLAFGQGYAFASQSLCILADQIVKVRSERAYYFGAGEDDANIRSDLGYKALRVRANAVKGLELLSDEVRGAVEGYAAGYNKYLAETGVDNLAPECQGAQWVKPIDSVDLFAYHVSLTLLASGEQLMGYMTDIEPPATFTSTESPGLPSGLPDFRYLGIGSNGWGIGKDLSSNGRGALLANPHFPATGPLKFYESHLTIPGELNVYGASLYGAPFVLIGFTENVAWTHTVATSAHFNLYRLTLVEGDPTSYIYDGEKRQMTSETAEIQVRQEDGTYTTESRTFWQTHYGPLVSMLPWTLENAYAMKDANEMNMDILPHWLAVNRSKNLEEFKDAFRNHKGIPWVNTMYADDQGNAFYIDGTPVPHLSKSAIDEFQTDPLSIEMYQNFGVVLLDGSKSTNEWMGDIGQGLVPFEEAPKLDRADFVANSNDSHWLSNPSAPLEDFSPLYGPEKTARSLRTRLGLDMLKEAGGEDGLFSMEEIRDAILSNRIKLGELIKEDLVTRCMATSEVEIPEAAAPINLTAACAALNQWDGRVNTDSVGAHVMREFGSYFEDDMFAVPFDSSNPADTPAGLVSAPATGDDPVLIALGRAVSGLDQAGIVAAKALGEIQFAKKNGEKIPIHGGLGSVGAFNVVSYRDPSSNRTLLPRPMADGVINQYTGLHDEGYLILHGTSFAFALEFTDDGPRAEGILTYSQSSDSRSENFSDQTKVYSQGSFRPILFNNEDIVANTVTTETVTAEMKNE